MFVALQYFYLYHFFENPVAQKNTPIFFPNIWEKKFEFGVLSKIIKEWYIKITTS